MYKFLVFYIKTPCLYKRNSNTALYVNLSFMYVTIIINTRRIGKQHEYRLCCKDRDILLKLLPFRLGKHVRLFL